tara:strand:- start:531 stop:710 length:180 start_codon:yes stop_codon:yes gene_type:complete
MFEEEEDTKKQKTIDLDDLSLEEIEDLIKNHEKEIKSLKSLLKKKQDKLDLAQNFFKKN